MATKKEISFLTFLKAKEQRLDWIILLISCIIGYIVIKTCYPFPATISDSGTYINAAITDTFSFYRPFGYSAYLQIVHFFSSSIHTIFITQIILYFLSTAAFAFVIKYIFPPTNKVLWQILLFFFVFSPIAFYMCNAIMSDLLFAVMIYFMMASFLYLFKKKSWLSLGIFLISLLFALQIRYSAIMFPALFICCFFMMKGKFRWIGIAGTLFVTLFFYNEVKTDMRKTTGFDQFSTGFDGWQLANNAIHIIPYIDLKPEKIADPQIRSLHEFVIYQKDVIQEKTKGGSAVSASFMWINDQPLKQYLFAFMDQNQQLHSSSWIWLGSNTYKNYGKYMITHYPIKYMQHYYFINSKNIFHPDNSEIIGTYTPINTEDALEWYNIPKDTDMSARHAIYNNFVADLSAASYIPIWSIILIAGIISFTMRKKLLWQDSDQQKIFWIISAVGILYYAATVFASPIALRFWIPMNSVLFAVVYILLNRIIQFKNKTVINKE